GIDRFHTATAPRKCEIDASEPRFDRQQPAGRRFGLSSREDDHASSAVHDRRDWRRIAWSPLRSGPPHLATGRLVEPCNRWPSWRANVDDQEPAFEQRRRCGSEEILSYFVLAAQVALPHDLS